MLLTKENLMNKITHLECPICGQSQIKEKYKLQDYTVSKEFYNIVQCESCGFMFTQSAPDAENIGPYYKSDDYVSHSNTQKGLFFKVYHKVREFMLEQKRGAILNNMLNEESKNILDIGTGRGYFLNHMQKNGFSCTGIEQDPDVRKMASDDFNLNIQPPEELYKLNNDQFDVITLWHVLEHVHDLRGYLEKIKMLLKKDGLLVIALPNPACADVSIYKEQWAGWDVPIHLWHFQPKNIQELLSQYQFKMVDKRRLPFDPFYVSILGSQQRGDKLPMFTGTFNGTLSYIKSLGNIDKSTSLIYFFKKE